MSKYKPAEDILACYEHEQLDFGENYVQELVDKAASVCDELTSHHQRVVLIQICHYSFLKIYGGISLALYKATNARLSQVSACASLLASNLLSYRLVKSLDT